MQYTPDLFDERALLVGGDLAPKAALEVLHTSCSNPEAIPSPPDVELSSGRRNTRLQRAARHVRSTGDRLLDLAGQVVGNRTAGHQLDRPSDVSGQAELASEVPGGAREHPLTAAARCHTSQPRCRSATRSNGDMPFTEALQEFGKHVVAPGAAQSPTDHGWTVPAGCLRPTTRSRDGGAGR